MELYYLNTVAQPNGEYIVHLSGCPSLFGFASRQYLGSFKDCADALRHANKTYDQVNGCLDCCKDCHTT